MNYSEKNRYGILKKEHHQMGEEITKLRAELARAGGSEELERAKVEIEQLQSLKEESENKYQCLRDDYCELELKYAKLEKQLQQQSSKGKSSGTRQRNKV